MLACNTGNLIAQTDMSESYRQQQLRWHSLLELCRAAAATRDPGQLIELVHAIAPGVIGCERVVLLLRIPRTDTLWTLVDPSIFESGSAEKYGVAARLGCSSPGQSGDAAVQEGEEVERGVLRAVSRVFC